MLRDTASVTGPQCQFCDTSLRCRATGSHAGAREAGQFEIYKDVGCQYRFRLKSRNGEIVATGESYPTKATAKKGVQAVQRAADGAKIVDAKIVDLDED